MRRIFSVKFCFIVALLISLNSVAFGVQIISRHLPSVAMNLQPLKRLEASNRLNLIIGLPLRNQEALTNLLQQLYDPNSPQFHRYLTSDQFAQQFGPTEQDYQSVIAFAKANGFVISGTHSNRTLIDINGSVADIERAFHIKMQTYQHPTERRTFFAPDSDLSVDVAVPILSIKGLNDFSLPHRMGHAEKPSFKKNQQTGTGPGNYFIGSDYRHAYAPGVTLTGTGQSVALFELDGYFASDITNYEALAGLPNVNVTNILIDGFDGSAGSGNEEVSLDIEIAIAMAPGLSNVLVYEGSSSGSLQNWDDILDQIAVDDQAAQISSSWGFTIDATSQQTFQQYAAQGQSFFEACGDTGAYPGAVNTPADDPLVTCVGGTVLTTLTNDESWSSETAWQNGSGGISTVYAIPSWQQGINMTTNQGSIYSRNVPDVSMIAADCWTISDDGMGEIEFGTSISAPMWAGFTALANEQAAIKGQPRLGLLNPLVYSIGTNTTYTTAFHDITTGNNTNSSSPNRFFAVPGYDLCTGWGTPTGSNLISALVSLDVIKPVQGLFAITSIVPANNNFSITWQTIGGTTNIVQVANGSLTNNFTDLSAPIFANGLGVVSTNYLDAHPTNTARFYRIKITGFTSADDASDPAYAGGWFYGDNGGTGFDPWIFTALNGINGFYIGSSTNNGGGESPGIDVNGKSWGISANNNYATAYRTFAYGALQVGQTLTFSMDNGYIDNGGPYVGFVLRNGNATDGPFDYVTGARFQFVFFGGSSDYQIYDNAGQQDSGIFFTDTGLRFIFTLTAVDTYTLQVINNASNTTNSYSGTLSGTAGSGINSIALFNFNAGGSPQSDIFFNSLKVK
jgi:subtilase family serine protease